MVVISEVLMHNVEVAPHGFLVSAASRNRRTSALFSSTDIGHAPFSGNDEKISGSLPKVSRLHPRMGRRRGSPGPDGCCGRPRPTGRRLPSVAPLKSCEGPWVAFLDAESGRSSSCAARTAARCGMSGLSQVIRGWRHALL